MKFLYSLVIASVALFCTIPATAQTTIPNAGFETWTGSGSTIEPTNWNSNKTGGGNASTGPQTCFQESNNPHGGTYCVRIKTGSIIGITVNGTCSTGKIEAPTTNRADGYIHTVTSDANFNSPFTGRPDSLVGWYRYTSVSGDYGRIQTQLHVGHGSVPESGSYQGNNTANVVARAEYTTPSSSVSAWTRFSVPFNYVDGRTPQYILCILTSSGNASGGSSGSEIFFDDLSLVYNPAVNIGTIATGPFYVTSTAGAAISVPFTLMNTFNAGNTVTAQLSDAAGSFASPVTIGTATTTASGTISATIPANTPTGSGYRIRVVTSNPALTSAANTSNIQVYLVSTSITPATTQNIATNTPGTQLTLNESPAANSRAWRYSTTPGGPYSAFAPSQTGSTYTPQFAAPGTYYVVGVSSYPGGILVYSNEVQINVVGNSIAPAAVQNLLVSVAGNTLTVTETPAGASREWKYATAAGGPYQSFSTAETGTTYVPLFNSAGTYYVVAQSIINGITVTSNEVRINVTSATITTGTISGSPFNFSASAPNATVSVPFTVNSPFSAGNVFTAQLSDASGSFASPANIGTLTATNSGSISATIPSATPDGNGYRIRVVSTNPAVTGSDNGVNLVIDQFSNSVAPTATQSIPTNTTGTTLTVSESQNATREWMYATTSGGPYTAFSPAQTGSTYIPQFTAPGTYYIVAVSSNQYNDDVTSNEVQVDVFGNIVTPATAQSIFTGVAGNTLTVTETPAGTSREWLYSTTSAGPYSSFSPAETGSTLDPLFNTAGTYYVVAQSVINGVTVTSNEVIISVGSAIINTGTVTGAPFDVSPSANVQVSVPFTVQGTINSGNIFTAQLSDAFGSFISPVNIGTLTGTTDGTITATLPGNTPTGAGYRIRVVADNPVTTGTDNGVDLFIDQFDNSVTSAATQTLLPGVAGVFIGVNESQNATREWLYSTTSGGPYQSFTPAETGASYQPEFATAGIYYVVSVSTNQYNDDVTSNEVIIIVAANSITPATTQNLQTGAAGTQLTLTETPAGTSREWKYATASGGPYQSFTPAQTGMTYTPLFNTPGTYYVVAQSVIGSLTVTSNEVVVNVVTATLATGIITGSPFDVSPSHSAPVNVPYTATGGFTAGNVFTAQLSDANGSFASAVDIGTATATTSGTITANIPGNTPSGSGYRIRVVSSTPAVVGTDNGANLVVDQFSNAVAPASAQLLGLNSPGAPVTVTPSQTATHEWKYATVSGGSYISFSPAQTGTGFTPQFATAGTYYVVAVSTNQYSDETISNEVVITVQSTQLINITSVSGAPFLVSPKAYVTTTIEFTTAFSVTSGTRFTAQLSDANGSFASPVVLGTDSGNITSMEVRIPNNSPSGTAYRIRVVAANPVVIGPDNGSDIEIVQFANSIAPVTTQTIEVNQVGDIINADENHPAYHEWLYSPNAGGPYTGFNPAEVAAGYVPYFSTVGTRYIVARSVNNWNDTVTSNEVTIQVSPSTGIFGPQLNIVNAYWNGSNLVIDLSSAGMESPQLELYSITGQLVMSRELNTASVNRIPANFASGMYLFRLTSGDTSLAGKVIKE